MAEVNDSKNPRNPAKPKAGIRKRLTKKQKALVKFVNENPDATQEQIKQATGYSAQSAVSVALHRPNVQQRMAELMEKDPALCDEALIQKWKEGLDSKLVSRSFDRNGELTGTYKDLDMAVRKSYLALVGKWRGLEVIKQEISGPGGGPIDFQAHEAVKQLTKGDLLNLIRVTDSKK